MIKAELIREIHTKHQLPIDKAETVVNRFFDTLADALKQGRRVEIRGFGTFQLREYDGYMGRNPRTGDSVTVPPKRLPFFKSGKEIRDYLNGGTES